MERKEIVPGQSEKIAVVSDESAFQTDEGPLSDLALQLFRGDGLLQVYVKLDRSLVRRERCRPCP